MVNSVNNLRGKASYTTAITPPEYAKGIFSRSWLYRLPGRFCYDVDMKKLYRSKSNRKIAGVCGGLAEYFGVDATIIRIIAVVLLLPGWLPGFVPYVILWIIVPEEPTA